MNTLNLDIRKARILTNRLLFIFTRHRLTKPTSKHKSQVLLIHGNDPRATVKKPASIFQIDNSEL